MAPPGNQAANGEHKHHAYSTEGLLLLDKYSKLSLWQSLRLHQRPSLRVSPAELDTSPLSLRMIIGVLHRQVFCLSHIVQIGVGRDEDESAGTIGSQLSLDD